MKQRTIGTIRLIAELYKKGVVREAVVHACIRELLGGPAAKPIEDNIEVRAPPSPLPPRTRACLYAVAAVYGTITYDFTI